VERGVVVALAVAAVLAVLGIGAGVGYLLVSNSPVAQVKREYANGTLGPPGVYSNLRIVSSSSTSVKFEFDIADGQHCVGQRQTQRAGPVVTAGGGSVLCSGGPWQRQFTPGLVYCDGNTLGVVGPTPTARGFTLRLQNTGAIPCHIEGPLQVVFFPGTYRNAQPLDVDLRATTDSATDIVLNPGQAVIAAYDVYAGRSSCISAGSTLITLMGAPVPAGAVLVCGMVMAHPVVRAA